MNIRERFVSGVAWRAGSRVGRQVAVIVVGIVLARLIGPREFGVVTMATVVIGFATLFDDLGMEAALVRSGASNDEQQSSVLWFSLALGGLLGVLTAAAGYPLASFYHEPSLIRLMAVLAVRFPIAATGVVHRAQLERTLDFRSLGRINFVSVVLGGMAGIALAAMGTGAWALVFQELAVTTAGVVQLWATFDWRPRFVFAWPSLRGLLRFGLYLMAFDVNAYVARNIDNVLIGRFYGKTSLALYNRAYSFLYIPLFLAQTVTSVLFPTLAALGQDLGRVKRTFLRVAGVVALLSWPPIVGLVVTADPFVRVVFGKNWIAMIPLVRLLAPVSLWQSVGMLHVLLFQATSRTDRLFRVNFFSNLLSVAGICAGLHWGPKGVAVGYLIGSAATTTINMKAALSQVDASMWEIIRVVWRIGLSCLFMGAAVTVLLLMIPGWPPSLRLVLGVAVGGIIYGISIHFSNPDAWRDLLQTARTLRGSERAVR